MSILAVGSIAFDNIATPSGRIDNVLGGSATHFSLAASYFTDVRWSAWWAKIFPPSTKMY